MANTVTFYYEIEKLLDNVRVISDYRTHTEIDRGEEKLIPSVNVADNLIGKKLLEDAGGEIALIVSGYFKNLVDIDGNELEGYQFDVTHEDTDNCIVFNLHFPDTFNTKVIGSLDRAVKSALENYVLSKYNQMVNFDFRLYEDAYQREIDKIRLYISRRTETIVRTYKTF